MKKIIVLAMSALFNAAIATAQVGTWRAYMAYHDISDIQKGGNKLYVLASNSLYTYNTNDQSIETFDKTNVMTDCGIQFIAWCQAAKRLVVLYENGNIDLMDSNGDVVNVSGYYDKTMTEDKTIYDLNVDDKYAYISTAFGIVKVDVEKAEISETYNFGYSVNYSYVIGNNLYAASNTNDSKTWGIHVASMDTNMQDPTNWSYVGPYTAKTRTIDPEMLEIVNTLTPGGPKYNYFGYIKFLNNKLYTCGGEQTSDCPGTIQVLYNDEWTIYQDENISENTGVNYINIYTLDVDPNNQNHVFAGARNGLYEFNNGEFTSYYDYQNSPIEIYDGNEKHKEYQLVTGVKFTSDGNLYILNSQAPTQSIIKLNNNGIWESYYHGELMNSSSKSLGDLANMILDHSGNIWFVNNNWTQPSFYCYHTSTDSITSYIPQNNQDGTSFTISKGVRCVAEDADGNMWVGTSDGLLMVYASDIASGNMVFNQVKIPRNDGTNLADYLLSAIDITAISIDGANRKWIGTNSDGVYLISADNMTQIEHFTVENSKLLSNSVQSLAIDGTKGLVYIGTDKGLCSYFSDSSEPSDEMSKDNVYAYPNPVRPEYTGLITIVGLTYNADVKITTSSGVLVAEGRSNGGSFTWDGRDSKGNRVNSGIYMVNTATQAGEKGTVCKIAIIR